MHGIEAIAIDLRRGRADDKGWGDGVALFAACRGTGIAVVVALQDEVGTSIDELVFEDVVHHQILSPVTHAVYGVVEEDDLPRLVRALEGRA